MEKDASFVTRSVEHIRRKEEAIHMAEASCKAAFLQFAVPRLVNRKQDKTLINADTVVYYKGEVHTMSMLCCCASFPVNVDFDVYVDVDVDVDVDTKALCVLRRRIQVCNAFIAQLLYGQDGILFMVIKALFYVHTGNIEMKHIIVSLATITFPLPEDHQDFIQHKMGMSKESVATKIMGYLTAFRSGVLKALMEGHVPLLSLHSFEIGEPSWDGPRARDTLTHMTSTETLFNVLEIRHVVEKYGAFSLKEALVTQKHPVFRYTWLFQELYFRS